MHSFNIQENYTTLHYAKDLSLNSENNYRRKITSTRSSRLRRMEPGQIITCTNKCGTSLTNSQPNPTTSCINILSSDNLNRSTNNVSNMYMVASPHPALNINQFNSRKIHGGKYSKEMHMDKSFKCDIDSQPAHNAQTQLKIKKQNRNVYSTSDESYHCQGSGYESDTSEDIPLSQKGCKNSKYNIVYSVPHTPVINSRKTQESPVQMFPVHLPSFKSSCLNYKSAYSSSPQNESIYPHFQTLEMKQNSGGSEDSLTLKQRQLDETTEQLRRAKEMVKHLEEEAQIKTWQALKEQEALLKQKEEALKYREIMAQKKYEKAIRLLDEFQKLSTCDRIKDKQVFGSHLKKTSLGLNVYDNDEDEEDDISLNLSGKEHIRCCKSHDFNKTLTIPQSLSNQFEIGTFASENQNLSDASVGLEHEHSFPHSKSMGKICGKKSKQSYHILNMSEIKPSIEPAKILRTYSRKTTRKERLEPKIDLANSSFIKQSQSISTQVANIDIPSSPRCLKEEILINESGSITITQVPRFGQSFRSTKRKSDRYPLSSLSHSLKKRPSRIDSDNSPYSSSSDLSVSFIEKVEKLTSSTSLQSHIDSSKANINTLLSSLESNVEINKIDSSSDCNTQYICNDQTTSIINDNEYSEIEIEDTSIKKIRPKRKLSMVTLQSVSVPSYSNNSTLSLNKNVPKELNSSSTNSYNYLDNQEASLNDNISIISKCKSEMFDIGMDLSPQSDTLEETMSENHSFSQTSIEFTDEAKCKVARSSNMYTEPCDYNGKNGSNFHLQEPPDIVMPLEKSKSELQSHNKIIVQSLSSKQNNFETPSKSILLFNNKNLKDDKNFKQILCSVSQSNKILDNNSLTTDQPLTIPKTLNANIQPVYILSQSPGTSYSVLSKSCAADDYTSQNNLSHISTSQTPTSKDEHLSNVPDNKCKKNAIIQNPSKDLGYCIPLSQYNQNKATIPQFSKLIEKTQPNTNVITLQPINEPMYPNLRKQQILYNEGLQINNIQNIIFDVKSINQAALSFLPQKCNVDKTDVGIPPFQTISTKHLPLVQYDQKIMQYISNTNQTVFCAPTLVYTSPQQNLMNSYATNIISSCPPMIQEENLRIATNKTTNHLKIENFQDSDSNDSDDNNNSNNDKTNFLKELLPGSQFENSEVSEQIDDSREDSQNSSNDIFREQEKLQNVISEPDHIFPLTHNKEVDLPEKNLQVSLDENSTDEISLLEDAPNSSIHSPSGADHEDMQAWLDKSKIITSFDDYDTTNKFDTAPEKKALTTSNDDCDNSLMDHSPDILEHSDREGVSDSQGEIEKKSSGLSSKGGRVLKLKEWWSDIIADSKKPKLLNETQQILSDKEQSKHDSEVLVKRKRGRPRLYSNKGLDEKKNNVEIGNSPFWGEYILPSNLEGITDFECGKCSNISKSVEEFKTHVFQIHSGLARLKNQSQEFNDVKSVNKIFKIVFAHQNSLHCDACGKDFISIVGYQYHRKTCKILYQNAQVVCSHCGKLVSNDCTHCCTDGDQNALMSEEMQLGGRKRRKAAKSCHDQMKLLYSDIDAGNDETDKDFESDERLKQYFDSNLDSSLHNEGIKEFAERIKELGNAPCINNGCASLFTSVKTLKVHLKNSCQKHQKTYICKICNFICKENEAISHIEKVHSDYLSDSFSEYESDVEISPKETKDVIRLPKSFSYKPCVPAKQMTLEFRESNYSSHLYPELICQRSDWIETQDFDNYLPESKVEFSPLFKVEKDSFTKSANFWERLDTFSGKKIGLGEILFAGGPIRAASWCPIPSLKENVSQYIALAPISNPDEAYPINKAIKHKGMIQIWNCGDLKCAQDPSLALCIAHEYGVVWSLDWCPSGIYETTNGNVEDETCGLNRLGLLSASFSDGSIRVYLIPHPHQINTNSKFFYKVPDFTLFPYSFESMEIQCLKVAWCGSKGHTLIAGSYTNGMVCIWNLTTTSLLLKRKDENEGTILYPINSIPAHNGVCATVSFCPRTNGQHIVTGGNDRTVRFWDLAQPEQPLTIIRKGIVTDSVWLPHWAGAFVSFDDAFNLGKNSTYFRENGFYGGTYRSVLGTNATVWSISGSDWFNSLAQVDEAGEVLVSSQTQLTCELSSEKLMPKKRYPIFSIQLQDLKNGEMFSLKKEYEPQNLSNPKENNPKSESHNLGVDFKEQPVSFAEAAEVYGLRIYDEEYTNFAKIDRVSVRKRELSESMEPGPLTIYPLMGASSISWNNNWGTHSWIFVGLNSGLGRIIRLSFLESDDGS